MSENPTKRIEQVRFYAQKGLTEAKIAQLLHVSERTIRRDMTQIKKDAGVWLEGKAKAEFIYSYKLTLDNLDAHYQKLEELLDVETDTMKKVYIISQMTSNRKLRLAIASEILTIKKYKCSNK